MTNKLIKSIFLCGVILILIKLISSRPPSSEQLEITLVVGIFLACHICLLSWLSGYFDDFFKKYTDPKLQKFCNWINRRNGTEC